MNPRQRRGALLMIVAVLGAVAVFVSVLSYVGQVRAQVGNKRPVLQLTKGVKAQERITSDMVRPVQNPTKWTPDTALRDVSDLKGKVAANDLPKGTYLQQGSVKRNPALQQGQREIAIMINAVTGVAGKVDAGSAVDIYATFSKSRQQGSQCAVRIISSVQVINVGQTRKTESSDGGQTTQSSSVPITFALSSKQSLELTYAEAFADTVRLARIGGTGNAPTLPAGRVCQMPSAGNNSGGGQGGSS